MKKKRRKIESYKIHILLYSLVFVNTSLIDVNWFTTPRSGAVLYTWKDCNGRNINIMVVGLVYVTSKPISGTIQREIILIIKTEATMAIDSTIITRISLQCVISMWSSSKSKGAWIATITSITWARLMISQHMILQVISTTSKVRWKYILSVILLI